MSLTLIIVMSSSFGAYLPVIILDEYVFRALPLSVVLKTTQMSETEKSIIYLSHERQDNPIDLIMTVSFII